MLILTKSPSDLSRAAYAATPPKGGNLMDVWGFFKTA